MQGKTPFATVMVSAPSVSTWSLNWLPSGSRILRVEAGRLYTTWSTLPSSFMPFTILRT